VHRTGIAPRKDLPDPMSDHMTATPADSADGPGALRIIGLAAVGVGLAALAGAAFVLSYAGIHAFAQQAGISARLARGYPLIFDVLLVVILAAVLALRGAGLASKVLAWACLLALVSAAAGADALHAAGRKLPAREAAVTAAIVPWVLVLIAFALLLAMLRQARLRRLAGNRVSGRGRPQTRWEPQRQPPAANLPLVPGFGPDEAAGAAPTVPAPPILAPPTVKVDEAAADAAESDPSARSDPARSRPSDTRPSVPRLFVPRQVTGESAADTAGLPGPDRHAADDASGAELAIDAEPAPDDPSSDETPASAEDTASLDDSQSAEAMASPDDSQSGGPEAAEATDPEAAEATDPEAAEATGPEAAEAIDPEMPVFHRMWSSPVPPAGG
jgi:hypothetical protein